MPHILILADHYPPLFAPRVLSIVRYLVEEGWHCVVCTEEVTEESMLSSGQGNVFAGDEDPCRVERIRLRKKFNRWESLAQALWNAKDRLFEQRIEQLVEMNEIDLILAFSYRDFPLYAASRLARRHNIPWVADCRDIVEQYDEWRFIPNLPTHLSRVKKGMLKSLGQYLVRKRNSCLQRASAVVTVSPWHVKQLEKSLPAVSVFCLYNGYDSNLFVPNPIATDRFRIVYTGRIMSLGMRDPSLLFEALASEALRPLVERGEIVVDWYTDRHSMQLLEQVLAAYPERVRAVQCMHHSVRFQKVPELLNGAAVILLLGNKEHAQGAHGIVSTKLFEALAMQKPILYVRSDEALVADMLQQAGVGLAATSSDEVIAFLQEKFAYRQKNGYNCIAKVEESFLHRFRRDVIAAKYSALLKGIMKKKPISQSNE